MSTQWDKHFDRVLSEGLAEYIGFQDYRFGQQFFLLHGKEIVGAASRLLGPVVRSLLDERRQEFESQRKLLVGAVEGDPYAQAESELEKAASLATKQAQLESHILEQFPTQADRIIQQLNDLIDVRFSRR